MHANEAALTVDQAAALRDNLQAKHLPLPTLLRLLRMTDMTDDAKQVPTNASDRSPSRPRRTVFLFAWLGALALIWGTMWVRATVTQSDWGVVNSAGIAAVALGAVGLAVWVVRSSGLSLGRRLALAAILLVLTGAFFAQRLPIELIHNGDVGVVGWRWRGAAPDRELTSLPLRHAEGNAQGTAKVGDARRQAMEENAPAPQSPAAWEPSLHDYPAFLGGKYWADAGDVQFDFEKFASPPRQVWERKIGAGWSSFATVGDLAVTQEQRGDQELVTAYSVATGDVLWAHADNVRWDPNGVGALGYAGPRATPSLHQGRVVTHGATGIVNCLDATTGGLIWSCDTLKQFGGEILMWGVSSSPLVFDDWVVVSVGAPGASVVAFDLATGDLRWKEGKSKASYGSPIRTAFGGVEQVVTVDEGEVVGRRMSDGEPLWRFPWLSHSDSDASASQPVPVGDDLLFVSKGYGHGSALMRIQRENGDRGAFHCEELWRKSVMKTKMGNVVVRDGFVYGLDDVYLQCIELETGRSRWKKRRNPSFGHGQVLLAGDALLTLTEAGEVVIADANPERYRERAAFPAVEGLTWNNPALAGSRLLVRNAAVAACYELPLRSLAVASGPGPDGERAPAANSPE
ncbi:MAG: PQQ-binding-like beta-propeller repeat protein [Planctomycetales bacterium]|nr:PQQ-binding-like beta-propeller repeat protein [Planctomycetales bacterium]